MALAAVAFNPYVSWWNTMWYPQETCWHCTTGIQQRERIILWGSVYSVFFPSTLLFPRPFRCRTSLFFQLLIWFAGVRGMSHVPILPLVLITLPLVKQGHCLGYQLEFCSMRQTWVELFLEELISCASEWVKSSIYNSWAPRDPSSVCCWDLPCF